MTTQTHSGPVETVPPGTRLFASYRERPRTRKDACPLRQTTDRPLGRKHQRTSNRIEAAGKMAPKISIMALYLLLFVLAAVDAKPPADDTKQPVTGRVAPAEISEGLQEIDNHGRITVPEGQSLPPHPAVGPGHNAPPNSIDDGGSGPVHYSHNTHNTHTQHPDTVFRSRQLSAAHWLPRQSQEAN
ncbi:hypothetical protein C7M84_004865 [Penaeus vannamei]|uniref:Uncharacterized protein n=1 Tax=Penaeus vannamei TaxID=6689 RepID=A0A423TJC4_PENVA|nr:hypothetical protein C7M84_004865 [Penaeus vannamei]